MAAPIGLVLDCEDPQRLAAFWAAALGYVDVGLFDPYVLLVDPDGVGPKFLLQAVSEAKSVKNRMHLDIDAVDIEAEASRLEGLGARRVEATLMHEHETTWILMEDPEGNEFCVCDGGAASGS
jgi:predicted enzyme related to lactoylglutathione lyase